MSVSFGNGVDLGNLVTATTNPVTGGSSFLGGDSTLKLRAGVTDLSAGIGETYTWATKPLASALTGQIFVPDVGIGGSYWYSDGSKWRPVGGRVVLKNTIVDVTHSTVVKTVMDYATLLAGLVQDGDIISVMVLKERTGGTSDTESTDLMVGSAPTAPGTTVGLGTGVLATSTIQFSTTWSARKESPTTIRPMSVTGSVGAGGNSSANAVATVPNMDTQTTYLQITSVLALGAGEVAHLRGFTVTLIAGS